MASRNTHILSAVLALSTLTTGQQVFVGDTGLAQSIGNRLTAMTTSIDARDFPAVMTAYISQPSPTLQSLSQAPAFSEADGVSLRGLFRAYWGRDGYANDFIVAAIDNNVSFWGVDFAQRQTTDGDGDESRDEVRCPYLCDGACAATGPMKVFHANDPCDHCHAVSPSPSALRRCVPLS